MSGKHQFMLAIVTQDVMGIPLNEVTEKYSTFNLLKSTECNIVKADEKKLIFQLLLI